MMLEPKIKGKVGIKWKKSLGNATKNRKKTTRSKINNNEGFKKPFKKKKFRKDDNRDEGFKKLFKKKKYSKKNIKKRRA